MVTWFRLSLSEKKYLLIYIFRDSSFTFIDLAIWILDSSLNDVLKGKYMVFSFLWSILIVCKYLIDISYTKYDAIRLLYFPIVAHEFLE